MAADPTTAPATRIVSHMNADHQDSVVRYAEYYLHISPWISRDARVLDISLNELVLSCAGKRYPLALKPPMSGWGDARERMVEMDREAVHGLGRSDITVKEYRLPQGFQIVNFFLVSATFVLLFSRENLLPGSLFYRTVLQNFPRSPEFLYSIQPLVFYPMLAIHLFEAFWMERTRLRKHSVPSLSILWWTWLASTFIEGYGAFRRFGSIVRKQQAEKEKRKH